MRTEENNKRKIWLYLHFLVSLLGLDFVLSIHSDFNGLYTEMFIITYFMLLELFLFLTSLVSIQFKANLTINVLMLFNSVEESWKVEVQSLYISRKDFWGEKRPWYGPQFLYVGNCILFIHEHVHTQIETFSNPRENPQNIHTNKPSR